MLILFFSVLIAVPTTSIVAGVEGKVTVAKVLECLHNKHSDDHNIERDMTLVQEAEKMLYSDQIEQRALSIRGAPETTFLKVDGNGARFEQLCKLYFEKNGDDVKQIAQMQMKRVGCAVNRVHNSALCFYHFIS